jgi:uncharacterized protein YcbX
MFDTAFSIRQTVSSYKVSQIWTYPIKSLGGVPMQHARVLPKGLESDRRWMLIDQQSTFMTQRVHHRMALFRPSWEGKYLRVFHGNESIDIPSMPEGPASQATIWDDVVSVLEVSTTVSRWFSEQLSMPCRLVAFPEDHTRMVDLKYNLGESQVSLADGYPLLIIGQSSLDDLNSRMEADVPMNRFRPNVVFTGGDPFVEDGWKRFKIGDNEFAAVKPCGRCVLPTVNQETGIMGREPLATLNQYRKRDGKVYFGMNLIPIDQNVIKVGDEISF